MRFYLIIKVFYLIIFNTNSESVFGLRNGNKYTHNRQELETTRSVRIQQNKCQNNEIPIFVHSAARTAGKYYDRRITTRNTWAYEAKQHNMRVTFVLGLPHNQSTQREILLESNKFGDILQFEFIDDYHNLTLKAIALLHWISINCLIKDYVIKTDDDIVVNIERLKERIENKTFLSGITGKMFKHSKPVRDINDKWFVPKEIFDKDYYPPYLSGFSYVMSTDIIEKLYTSAVTNSGPVLDIDDLYMTGIVAQKSNIQIHNSPEFMSSSSSDSSYVCGVDVCKMQFILALHGCDSVNSTLTFWDNWRNNTSHDSCHNFFVKLHKMTTSGKIALIIAIVLLITFVLSMIAMVFQYYANYRDFKWQKVNVNVNA